MNYSEDTINKARAFIDATEPKLREKVQDAYEAVALFQIEVAFQTLKSDRASMRLKAVASLIVGSYKANCSAMTPEVLLITHELNLEVFRQYAPEFVALGVYDHMKHVKLLTEFNEGVEEVNKRARAYLAQQN